MGDKLAGPHYNLPAFPSAGVAITAAATANVLSGFVTVGTATAASFITGVGVAAPLTTAQSPTYCGLLIATGTTGAEATQDQLYVPFSSPAATTSGRTGVYHAVFPYVSAAASTPIRCKTASDVVSIPFVVWLEVVAQTNVADDGIVDAVNVTQIAGTTSKGTAGYVGIDWAQINAPTTVQGLTGTTIAASQTIATVTGNVVGSVGSISGITFPTNFAAISITTAGAVKTQDTYPTNFTALAITTGGAITVGTNNDKTGYSLTQGFPANFASISITTAGAVLTQDAYPANFASLAITTGGAVTVGTNNDKTGYSLSQAFPTNFASIAITTAGALTVGTNNDKTGYTLTQAFPSNFALTAITTAGAVTVGTNNDKTGYALTQAFPVNFATLSIDANGNASITSNIKKNTAFANFMFIMTDSTNHQPKTGLAVTATRSLDAAAFAACANAVTEVSGGWYSINLAATDTNANRVALMFTASGADTTNIEINTQP